MHTVTSCESVTTVVSVPKWPRRIVSASSRGSQFYRSAVRAGDTSVRNRKPGCSRYFGFGTRPRPGATLSNRLRRSSRELRHGLGFSSFRGPIYLTLLRDARSHTVHSTIPHHARNIGFSTMPVRIDHIIGQTLQHRTTLRTLQIDVWVGNTSGNNNRNRHEILAVRTNGQNHIGTYIRTYICTYVSMYVCCYVVGARIGRAGTLEGASYALRLRPRGSGRVG